MLSLCTSNAKAQSRVRVSHILTVGIGQNIRARSWIENAAAGGGKGLGDGKTQDERMPVVATRHVNIVFNLNLALPAWPSAGVC